MRTIKFRAWNEVHQRMDKVDVMDLFDDIKPRTLWTADDKHRRYDTFPIMQFTGLIDKNGGEIFEGDIVKTVYLKIGTVVFHEERASFIIHDAEHFNVQLFNEMPLIEIIGNVYENFELLKKVELPLHQ